MKNSWQHNDSTNDSKSISNLLVLLLEVTYLIWGSLNKDSLKSSYNRWVTKPSSHTSNFLRCSLYSFQFFFFFFSSGRIFIDREFASVKFRQNSYSEIVGFSLSSIRLQLRTKYGLYFTVSFSCLLSFPFHSLFFLFFCFQGLEIVLYWDLKVHQCVIFFVNLSQKTMIDRIQALHPKW